MAYQLLPLPGVNTEHRKQGGWEKANLDSVRIAGRRDEPISVTVIVRSFNELDDETMPRYFTITFSDVLEYRFIDTFASYEDIPAHENDYQWGLIEILGSAYIENMASKGRLHNFPIGQRFGKFDADPISGGIAEADVRHFRLGFDEWGRLDVIALAVSIVVTDSA